MTEIKSDREKMREDGYQAGLRGLELEECPLWGKAWGPVKGTNAPAYLIAGWIAGNAMWLHAKKLAGEGPKPPVSSHDPQACCGHMTSFCLKTLSCRYTCQRLRGRIR
jgi:ribosome modulation factor